MMHEFERWLSSGETGAPFRHCVGCRLPLVETVARWLVNREFRHGECVLEYAVCEPCRDQVTDRFSESSKEAVRHFLEREIDWEMRVAEFEAAADPAIRFENCIACRIPRESCEGYAISALFAPDGRVLGGPLPLLLCAPCILRATAGVSPETRAIWRDFLARNFDPPLGGGEAGLL